MNGGKGGNGLASGMTGHRAQNRAPGIKTFTSSFSLLLFLCWLSGLPPQGDDFPAVMNSEPPFSLCTFITPFECAATFSDKQTKSAFSHVQMREKNQKGQVI